MRLLVAAGAATLLSVADSEVLPSGAHAVLRPGLFASTGAPLIGRRRLIARPNGVAGNAAALWSLRGGGFSWGAPEPSSSSPRGRAAADDNPNGNSGENGHVLGMLGNAMSAAWGGGSSINDNESNRDKRRVETRGPPDQNVRPPATAPRVADSSMSRYTSSDSNNSFGRDGVRTLDPPDVVAVGGRERERRGARVSTAPGVRRFLSTAQRAPAATAWAGGDGRTVGGSADPYWPSGKTSGTETGRGDDGEDGARWREAQGGRTGLMAVHYLVLSCFGLFSLNTIFKIDRLFALSLNHTSPMWWQPATSLLLHGDQYHLMSNMFNLLIFGKMAEEDMGSVGMLLSFVTCGVVSSLASLLIMPKNTHSFGASGAIFGLYSVCVLGKMFNLGWRYSSEGRLRKLIEACVFGWFVVESVLSEVGTVAGGGVMGTDHAAHFGGVLAGAVFILLARRSIDKGKVNTRDF